jgi:hypothetical protein
MLTAERDHVSPADRAAHSHRAGFALAYSNRFAGQLSDLTVQRGMGNVGCFYGGGAAAVAAAVLIILFWKFGSLGQDPLEVEKRKAAQA